MTSRVETARNTRASITSVALRANSGTPLTEWEDGLVVLLVSVVEDVLEDVVIGVKAIASSSEMPLTTRLPEEGEDVYPGTGLIVYS